MTKNARLSLIGLVLIAAISATTVVGVSMMASPRLPTPINTTKFISAADNGTTVTLKKGDLLRLTLKDFGDGGYSWNITARDTQKLALSKTSHCDPSGALGDFGDNIWDFTALQPGTSSLDLICARPWAPSDVCTSFHIQVVVQ